MRREDARAHHEQAKAYAKASALAAAEWAEDADAWLRAMPSSREHRIAARRAVLATRLLRDLLDPDNGGGVRLLTDGDLERLSS